MFADQVFAAKAEGFKKLVICFDNVTLLAGDADRAGFEKSLALKGDLKIFFA